MTRRVVLVCGPPSSGKSTWVRQQAEAGDQIVDFDAICRDLGSSAYHDHPPSVRERAQVARRAQEARISQMQSGTAWVIRSAPDPDQRRSLALAVNATEIVVVTTPADEARRRAARDNRPIWTGPAIDRWWQRYQPSSSRQERELSLSQPLEGYRPMPENEQQNNESTEQDTTEVEEAEETPDSTGDNDDVSADGSDSEGEESQEDQPKPKPPAFDAKRAEAKIRKANSEAANLRRRLKELEPLAAKAQKLEDANKTEAERLQVQLEAADKRVAAMRDRAVKSEVRSLAADLFADKTDPEAHLTLSDYVTDDGEIDTDRIEADLAELLDRKPHLGKPKAEPERKRPAPDKTQASSANGKRTSIDPAEEFAGIIQSRLGRR